MFIDTLLGNLFYCEGCLKFIAGRDLGRTGMTVFHVIAILIIFQGAQLNFGLAWDTADVLMGVMAIINLPVIVLLGDRALKALDDYLDQKRHGEDPVFKKRRIGIMEETDFWN